MIKAHTKTGLNRKELHQMNKAHVRFTHKIIMLLLILFIICGLPFAAFSMISERIPATICMRENEYKTIDFNLPITANMEISSPVTAKSVKSVNFLKNRRHTRCQSDIIYKSERQPCIAV